jgi:hypothetical protein
VIPRAVAYLLAREDELTELFRISADTGVTVVVNDILRVLLAVPPGAEQRKQRPSSQDNRGSNYRSTSATTTLIAGFTIDALEDLETKLGLIRSFLGIRCAESVTTETTNRLVVGAVVVFLGSHKGFDVVAGDKPRIGTARRRRTPVGPLWEQS